MPQPVRAALDASGRVWLILDNGHRIELPVGASGDGGGEGGSGHDHPQYVRDTGDTMTGHLRLIGRPDGPIQVGVDGTGPSGYAELAFYRDGVARWFIRTSPGSAALEADLQIIARNDDGSAGPVLITLDRSSAEVKVNADPISPLGVATKRYADEGLASTVSPSGNTTSYATCHRSGGMVHLSGYLVSTVGGTINAQSAAFVAGYAPPGFRPAVDDYPVSSWYPDLNYVFRTCSLRVRASDGLISLIPYATTTYVPGAWIGLSSISYRGA